MSAQAVETNFCGKLVRLAVLDAEKDAELWSKWNQNSEYQQLLDWGPANLFSAQQIRGWIEKESREDHFEFSIHTLAEGKPIGFVGLGGVCWTSGDGWIGIGIGEREYWGKGYGSEAMNLMLRFAFEELNLTRVSLDVFEYNQRAIKSYQKIGFKEEGRQRQLLNRFDRRWDLIFMGILREEWQEKNMLPPASLAENLQEQEWQPSPIKSAHPTPS